MSRQNHLLPGRFAARFGLDRPRATLPRSNRARGDARGAHGAISVYPRGTLGVEASEGFSGRLRACFAAFQGGVRVWGNYFCWLLIPPVDSEAV